MERGWASWHADAGICSILCIMRERILALFTNKGHGRIWNWVEAHFIWSVEQAGSKTGCGLSCFVWWCVLASSHIPDTDEYSTIALAVFPLLLCYWTDQVPKHKPPVSDCMFSWITLPLFGSSSEQRMQAKAAGRWWSETGESLESMSSGLKSERAS